jgi:hypothetical protein
VGPFLGVAIYGPLLRLTMAANIGDIGQPSNGDFVEVFQRVEGPAVEQIRLDVMELPFDLALRRSRHLHLICAVDEELFESRIRFTPGAVASLRS